jgi:Fe-S-cluster containining protein
MVPITDSRLERIRAFVDRMPSSERVRLSRQKREPLTCGFLDTKTYRCSIYPVRPYVCEAYGRTAGLECPKVGHLVQILPATLVDMKLDEEGRHVAMTSDHWRWQR